jgi:nucleoside-diphosphate-sugar epimerase
MVGDGENEVSLTWIENAVEAHLAAARRLEVDAPHGGRTFFIAQQEPVALWGWIGALLEALEIPPPRRRLSGRSAYVAGALCEGIWQTLRLGGEPPMTRFLALQLASSHSYDMSPAREAFGYRELVSMEEATRRLLLHLRATDAPEQESGGRNLRRPAHR